MLLVPNAIAPVIVPPVLGRASVAVVCAVVIRVSNAGMLKP